MNGRRWQSQTKLNRYANKEVFGIPFFFFFFLKGGGLERMSFCKIFFFYKLGCGERLHVFCFKGKRSKRYSSAKLIF